MKGLIIYVKETNFNAVKQVLFDNQVDAITYFDVMGQGHLEREAKKKGSYRGIKLEKNTHLNLSVVHESKLSYMIQKQTQL